MTDKIEYNIFRYLDILLYAFIVYTSCIVLMATLEHYNIHRKRYLNVINIYFNTFVFRSNVTIENLNHSKKYITKMFT